VENGANVNSIIDNFSIFYTVMLEAIITTNIDKKNRLIEIAAYLITKGVDVNFIPPGPGEILSIRQIDSEIYERTMKIATSRTKVETFETITTSFVKKNREPLSSIKSNYNAYNTRCDSAWSYSRNRTGHRIGNRRIFQDRGR
jgi:hypothetical protein